MKRKTVPFCLISLVPAVIIACCVLAPKNSNAGLPTNNVGVYFDEMTKSSCLDTITSYPVVLSAHVILKNISDTGGLQGWEARLSWDDNLIVNLTGFRGEAISFGTFPDITVGLGEPLEEAPGDSLIVLADLSIVALGPGSIYLKPASQPMIQGAENPIFVFGNNPTQYALMSYAYGDSGSACAAIGNISCPKQNNYLEIPPNDDGSDLASQLIVVLRHDSMYLPDEDGVFTYSSLSFSSQSLMNIFASNESMTTFNVFPHIMRILKEDPENPVLLIGGNDAFVIDVGDPRDRDGIEALLLPLPEVLSVEPNGVVANLTDDPGYSQQWGLHGANGIHADTAWERSTGSSSVTICIVDRGVRDGHVEFLGKRSGDINYSANHGAQVAGIAAALTNNNYGVAGVSWGAEVNLQFVGGSVADAASAISQGLLVEPEVMNHSYELKTEGGYGVPIYSPLVHRLFMDAYKLGIVHSVASGNSYSSGNPRIYPACNGWAWDGYAQGMMVVGANDEFGNMYNNSSSGPQVDHLGPGVNVVVVSNQSEFGSLMNGTSFAAPFSAGAAAILLSIEPSLDPNDVEAILNMSAIDMFTPGHDDRSGWGHLDIAAAIDSLTMNEFTHSYAQTSQNIGESSVMYRHGFLLEGFPGHPSGPYDFELMRVTKSITFQETYKEPPHVWGRGNGSTGLPEYSWYNMPYTEVVEGSVTTTGCTVRSYVYRLGYNHYLPNSYSYPFFPLKFAFTILGKPIGTSAVEEGTPSMPNRDLVTIKGPNPFNARIELTVVLSGSVRARFYICDASGRCVRTFDSSFFEIGENQFFWNGADDSGRALPSGVYFAVLESGEIRDSKKLVLVK